MFSALFRIVSWLILAYGVIIAVVDATRSVAANSLQLTSLGETLETYWPVMAENFASWRVTLAGKSIGSWSLSNVIDYLNAIPVALLAAGLFLLIYGLASRKRAPRHF
jgi:hypothetical protein